MALQVEPLDRSEIAEAAALHQRAFAEDPLINSAFPSAAQSPKWLQHMADALDMAYGDSAEFLLKIQHPETRKLMGIVEWQDCTRQSEDESSSGAPTMPPPLEGANMELVTVRRKLRAKIRQSIIGDRPHYYLCMIATDTAYRRQGVARSLVQWGLDRAAAAGVEVYLEAGRSALPFYQKMGFVIASTITIPGVDASPDGLQDKIYCMTWESSQGK